MTVLDMRAIPLRKKPDLTPFISMDVETFPDTGMFRYGYVYGYHQVIKSATKDGKKFKVKEQRLIDRGFWNQEEMTDFIGSLRLKKDKGIPCKLTLFNLSHDYNYLRKVADEKTLLMAGGRIIYVKLKNGIEVQDIANHSPGESLDSWITSLKMDNPSNNLCGEHIEKTVYREDMTDDEIEKHCRWDTMATWELTMWWVNFLKQFNLSLRLTIGSQAVDAQQRLFFQNPETGKNFYLHRDDNDEANDFFRQGYYGGRVELWYGYRKWTELACFDINSTYPDAMINNVFPDPMTLKWGSMADDWEKHLWEHQGFYELDVYVPTSTNIPVLPTKEPTGKLLFKVGYLHGVWTAEEIRYAVECGAEILKCHRYVWFAKSIPFFREFEQWCVDNRFEAKKKFGRKSPQDSAFKRLGNAAYGKYGQRVSDDAYVGSLAEMPPEIREKAQDIEAHLVDGEWMISYPGSRKVYSAHSFVEMAAYVTAFARLKLTKAAHAVEKKGLIPAYCDTDSLKITNRNGAILQGDRAMIGDVIDVGDSLGQWEFEGIQTRYLAAPKFILAKDDQGDVDLHDPVNRLKGMKKDATTTMLWTEEDDGIVFLEQIDADMRRPLKIKEAIRRGETPSKWIEQHKVFRPEDTKRVWTGHKSCPIYSPKPASPLEEPPPSPSLSENSGEQSTHQSHTGENTGQGQT